MQESKRERSLLINIGICSVFLLAVTGCGTSAADNNSGDGKQSAVSVVPGDAQVEADQMQTLSPNGTGNASGQSVTEGAEQSSGATKSARSEATQTVGDQASTTGAAQAGGDTKPTTSEMIMKQGKATSSTSAMLQQPGNAVSSTDAATQQAGSAASSPSATPQRSASAATHQSRDSSGQQPNSTNLQKTAPTSEMRSHQATQQAVNKQNTSAAKSTTSLQDQIAKVRAQTNVLSTAAAADVHALINKQNGLPASYIPSDLVKVNVPFSFAGESPKKMLRKEAATALEALFAQAAKENIKLVGVSGYRPYDLQEAIFASNVKSEGFAEANRTSAIPGQSEHQTGLSIDVSSPVVKNQLTEKLGTTAEGKWLANHASTFGFIIRYPEGKEKVTGYSYEPWHIRYVGKELAETLQERHMTLEEYYQTESQEQPPST